MASNDRGPAFGQPAVTFGAVRDDRRSGPHSRLAWTNEESDERSVTTVTFAEQAGKTLLTMHELYPSTEALDAAGGAADAMGETFKQLDELLVTLGSSEGRSRRTSIGADVRRDRHSNWEERLRVGTVPEGGSERPTGAGPRLRVFQT